MRLSLKRTSMKQPRKSKPPGTGWIKAIILFLMIYGAVAEFLGGLDMPIEEREARSDRRPVPESMAPPKVVTDEGQSVAGQDPRLRAPGPIADIGSGQDRDGVYTGTAFPIDDQGHYLTARHVVERCTTLGLFQSPRQARKATVTALHRTADIALIKGPANLDTPFPLIGDLIDVNRAYSVGYPSGEAGGTRLSFMTTVRVRGRGSFKSREDALFWAVEARYPRFPRLGGHSGGPVFDDQGRVIGILIAGNDRRGRAITSRPRVFNAVLSSSGVRPIGRDPVAFRSGELPEIINDMTTSLRVRKVYCKR